MSAPTRVSVALCTYNGAGYIREQLESILAQSVRPDQLVVADDGSTDGTLDVARPVLDAAVAAGVSVVVLPGAGRLGVSKNFERALERVDGDVVFLSDQDDRWHLDHVSDLLTTLAAGGARLAHADARLIDDTGRPLDGGLFRSLVLTPTERAAMEAGEYLAVLVRRNVVTGATVAFDARLLVDALPIGDGWVHDEWLAMVAALTGRVALSEHPTIDYRQHASNAIGAGQRSVRAIASRVLGRRDDRTRLLALRMQVLIRRMSERGDIAPCALELLERKREMEEWRSKLPLRRLRRVRPVLRRARAGDYRRYCSRGDGDILRDILQAAPAHEQARHR